MCRERRGCAPWREQQACVQTVREGRRTLGAASHWWGAAASAGGAALRTLEVGASTGVWVRARAVGSVATGGQTHRPHGQDAVAPPACCSAAPCCSRWAQDVHGGRDRSATLRRKGLRKCREIYHPSPFPCYTNISSVREKAHYQPLEAGYTPSPCFHEDVSTTRLELHRHPQTTVPPLTPGRPRSPAAAAAAPAPGEAGPAWAPVSDICGRRPRRPAPVSAPAAAAQSDRTPGCR